MQSNDSNNYVSNDSSREFSFDRDISVENLSFLSSEQALADLANFIKVKNSEYKFDSNVKWIAFGGSYPGSLAAWLREKYSDLVHGSISTSGPLLAEADFMGNFINIKKGFGLRYFIESQFLFLQNIMML